MQFSVSFNCDVKEGKKAVNTVQAISALLATATISFSRLKNSGHPAIFVQFSEETKSKFVALYDKHNTYFDEVDMQKYGDWKTALPCRTIPDETIQEYIFEHLTDAASVLVREWIVFLCSQYEQIIESDSYEPGSVKFKMEKI